MTKVRQIHVKYIHSNTYHVNLPFSIFLFYLRLDFDTWCIDNCQEMETGIKLSVNVVFKTKYFCLRN